MFRDVSIASVPDVYLSLPAVAARYQLRVRVRAGQGAGPEFPLAFEPWLYLLPAYQEVASPSPMQWLFCLEDVHKRQTIGWLTVFATGAGAARNAYQAPFGGVQLAEAVPGEVLHRFLQAAQHYLRMQGIETLEIKCAPAAYSPRNAVRLAQSLTVLGYAIQLAEVNYHLDLTTSFEGVLHPSERRRLRKCQRAGLHFEQEPPLLLPAAYEFIVQCRQEKNQHFSVDLARLQALFRRFPRDYFLFSVRDANGEWAALTIAVRVNGAVLYNFAPASPRAYNAFSPVVLLTAGLHHFGQANGMTLLDLGTSMLGQEPNFSLLRFKEHLGGVPSLKFTFGCQPH
ncbi:GNAT family N-acetyltransferase [Hymenobacter lutimineralis]|uniref:GNAT family N-acetyltransferase n=1 Tax=Hymenobacter lutimineralis TaxID=2606448 RepID=A0A5D6UXV0_9BACT|nr:GNAT family N-acetyltransferase [Hymenobacter lutimineralis]TYZ07855.1 GNAT family N-acetyltransferase [Hymenobacter lutimineralis]